MASSEIFTSAEAGSLWIQPSRPNTLVSFLPCFDLEDITQSKGSITLIQCVNQSGQYETLGATIGIPEVTTTTLGTYIGKVADFIETVTCPFALYVLLSCGKKGVFENWERGFLLSVKAVTNRTISGLVRREEDVPAMHTFDIEAAPEIISFFRLSSTEQSVDSGVTGDLVSMRFSDDVACWDSCGATVDVCEIGVATTVGGTAATANVLLSPSLGGTADWAATAADPFAVAEDIVDVALFKIGRNTTRILVVRGTTDGANPMEIAYSDDNGATWTLVDVGSTVGEFAIKKGALAHLGGYELYLVSNLGRIYKSEDFGVTWTVREDANITAAAYNAVYMLNPSIGYAVGTAGLVVKTIDGGKTWGQVGSTAGSNDLMSVWVLGRNRVWVGSTLGVMYETVDGGDSWSARNVGDLTASVNDQAWMNDYFGVVANGETIQFTINGGYSWEQIEDTTNLFSSDMVSVNVCSTRLIYGMSPDEIVQSAQ